MSVNKSTRELKNEAKAALEKNTLNKLLLFAIPIIWNIFSLFYTNGSPEEYLNYNDTTEILNQVTTSTTIPDFTLSFIGSLLISFITAAIVFNYMAIFKNPERKIEPIKDISKTITLKFVGKIFIIALLTSIYALLWSILPLAIFIFAIIYAVLTNSILYAFLAILSFIAILIIAINRSLAYSQTTYILYQYFSQDNQKVSAGQVIKDSVELMKGEKMNLFILELSFILWQLLVLISFGLASIWVIPYITMTEIAFHNHIKEKKQKVFGT